MKTVIKQKIQETGLFHVMDTVAKPLICALIGLTEDCDVLICLKWPKLNLKFFFCARSKCLQACNVTCKVGFRNLHEWCHKTRKNFKLALKRKNLAAKFPRIGRLCKTYRECFSRMRGGKKEKHELPVKDPLFEGVTQGTIQGGLERNAKEFCVYSTS